MSHLLTLKCKHCDTSFNREYGISIMGHGILYCPQCGSAQQVDLSSGWEPIPPCTCGDTFDANALGTCPHCGKLLDKEDICDPQPSI